MKRILSSVNPSKPNTCTTTTYKLSIIYEDRAAGLRGKRFADDLAAALAHEGECPVAMWRSELLDLPGIADQAANETASAEFVILSLRGDAGLSVATKNLIEAWLCRNAGGPASLIALFDPERSDGRFTGSICSYLEHVAKAAGIVFFSRQTLISTKANTLTYPSPNSDSAESKPRRQARGRRARLFPATLAA